MITVVPSQVREFIDLEFANIPRDNGAGSQALKLSSAVCGSLRALVSFASAIPNGLLPADTRDLADLFSSLEAIKFQLSRADREGVLDSRHPGNERDIGGSLLLLPAPTSGNWNPVMVIYRVLERCLDEPAHTDSDEFAFVKDPDVRRELLADLESARSALRNAEWKPATVMAGSLAEALLLWAVDQFSADDIRSAVDGAMSQSELQERPRKNPEDWGLQQYVAVADQLGILEEDCRKALELLRPFRNFIHPGRARKAGKRCDRGSAHIAHGGIELLARDLAIKFR